MKTIHINGFEVGGEKTYIIADVGSNHMQDLQLAKESIDAAKFAGADAVKFQSIQLNELYLCPDKDTSDFVKKLEFPEAWHYTLKAYADQIGITFFSSPTYLKAVDILEEIQVPVYKLASAQVGTFPQIVEKVASLQKPTIFSTGIAAINEIEQVAAIFQKHQNDKFIILHCNSIYPTPANRVNLPFMQYLAEKYPNNPVGFSDHTIGTHTACAAVTMGAKVIEKHFTLDRNFSSPDSNAFSCDPDELSLLVKQIREVEMSILKLDNREKIQDEELIFKTNILYKCIAFKNINVGEKVNIADIRFLRTTEGLDARLFMQMNNRAIAAREIKQGEPITISHLTYE